MSSISASRSRRRSDPTSARNIVRVPADQRFEAVRDGRVDILCDPSSVTMPRREMVDFSLPTFLDGASVISRTSRPVRTLRRSRRQTHRRARRHDHRADAPRLAQRLEPQRDHRSGPRPPRRRSICSGRTRSTPISPIAASSPPSCARADGPASRSASNTSATRPTRWRCRATTARSVCWSTGRWRGSIAAEGSTPSWTRPSARRPPDDLLKAMFVINSLPDR